MKEPKYILRIAGQEFVVATNSGIATLINMMEEVVPVHADLGKREIELTYCDDEEMYPRMLEMFRTVTIKKIPAGIKWTRKNKRGEVEIVQVVKKPAKALPAPKRKELPPPRKPWTALPPRSPQLSLL